MNLEHSPADIVRYALVDMGEGSAPLNAADWPISVGYEPDSPDSCVTLYDTTGTPDGRSQVDGEVFEHPGVQLRVRASGHQVCWTKMNELVAALDSIYHRRVTIGSSTYSIQVVANRTNPESLGKEEKATKRDRFVVNFTVSVTQEG